MYCPQRQAETTPHHVYGDNFADNGCIDHLVAKKGLMLQIRNNLNVSLGDWYGKSQFNHTYYANESLSL